MAPIEESGAEQKGPGGLGRELEKVLGLLGEDRPRQLGVLVVVVWAANRCQQRPATAHNSRTIRANCGYVRTEKRKVVRQRGTTENLAYASVRFRYLAGGGLLGRAERPFTADFHPCRVMNSARLIGAMVSDAHTRNADLIRSDQMGEP